MDTPAFTAYPTEAELLLTEGCRTYILAIDKDIKIKANDGAMKEFDGKVITIIHLFHKF